MNNIRHKLMCVTLALTTLISNISVNAQESSTSTKTITTFVFNENHPLTYDENGNATLTLEYDPANPITKEYLLTQLPNSIEATIEEFIQTDDSIEEELPLHSELPDNSSDSETIPETDQPIIQQEETTSPHPEEQDSFLETSVPETNNETNVEDIQSNDFNNESNISTTSFTDEDNEPVNINENTETIEDSNVSVTVDQSNNQTITITENSDNTQPQTATVNSYVQTLDIQWDLSLIEEPIKASNYQITAKATDSQIATSLNISLNLIIKLRETTNFIEQINEDKMLTPLNNSTTTTKPDNSNLSNYDKFLVKAANTSSTIVNVFDYWTGSIYHEDEININDARFEPDDKDGTVYIDKTGINALKIDEDTTVHHDLTFGRSITSNHSNGVPISINRWVNGSAGHETFGSKSTDSSLPINFVKKTLNQNGYPEIVSGTHNTLSTSDTKDKFIRSKGDSLDYLFDPEFKHDGKKSFKNVTGLMQIDRDGYYYYNSLKNHAYLDENDPNNLHFKLYNAPGIMDNHTDHSNDSGQPRGQFFPFNSPTQIYKDLNETNSQLEQKELNRNSSLVNHYFGLTMSTRFKIENGGKDKNGKPLVYNFSGDDDVWLFIDGVLVGDLGGNHNKLSLQIDFSTGEVVVYYDGNKNDNIYDKDDKDDVPYYSYTNSGDRTDLKTLKQLFEVANAENQTTWDGNTFANNTYHRLDFFYLERGNQNSNLSLKYNLVDIPSTIIKKVDQYNKPVENAKFKLIKCDENFTPIVDENSSDLPTFITNEKGEILFGEDGLPYAMEEIITMYGNHFILRETKTPDGFRMINSDIYIEITEDEIMTVRNQYDSGAWAAGTLKMNAPSTLKVLGSEETIDFSGNEGNTPQLNGSLFAVALKYIGQKDANNDIANVDDLNKLSNWAPVSGSELDGYVVHRPKDETIESFKKSLYETFKKYTESKAMFDLSSSGTITATLVGLPGFLETYYNLIKMRDSEEGKNKLSETEYAILLCYTDENISNNENLSDEQIANIKFIDTSNTNNAFSYEFAANLEIANFKNKITINKTNETGTQGLNGATFAIYDVTQDVNDGDKWYYKADQNNVFIFLDNLNKDTTSSLQGNAFTKDNPNLKGIYEIDPNTGVISVSFDNNVIYSISPSEVSDENGNPTVGVVTTAQKEIDKVTQNGMAEFIGLKQGYYIIREIKPSEGYTINPTEIMAVVTSTDISVNAGNQNDGISVGRGPGYLSKTLTNFANNNEIDNTLTWLYEEVIVSDNKDISSKKFAEGLQSNVHPSDDNNWSYVLNHTGAGLNQITETTTDMNKALRHHIVFKSANVAGLTNYELNTDFHKEDDNTMLYHSYGWSQFHVHQDLEYALDNKQPGATYDELTDLTNPNTPKNLSKLFSKNTIVFVADKPINKYGKLLVTKKVEKSDVDQEFNFEILLDDGYSNPYNGSVSITYNDHHSQLQFNNGKATFTLKHNKKILFENLPIGTHYRVSELSTDGYEVKSENNIGTIIEEHQENKVEFINTKIEHPTPTPDPKPTPTPTPKPNKPSSGGDKPDIPHRPYDPNYRLVPTDDKSSQ